MLRPREKIVSFPGDCVGELMSAKLYIICMTSRTMKLSYLVSSLYFVKVPTFRMACIYMDIYI